MRCRWTGIVFAAFLAASSAVNAHHSFTMFDQLREIELEGVVKEFRYIAPHTLIILEVRQKNGAAESWSLEGASAIDLARDGWTRTSLKPGDKIKARIAPLRNGAPGGSWVTKQIEFRDGTPIVPTIPKNEN
jgi:hypothetical protein